MYNKDKIYINKVLSHINCSKKLKNRIKEDLLISLAEKREYSFNRSAEDLLGNPYEVALEFIENLNLKENKLMGYEYISNTKVFGIPLVHVNTKNRRVAKGIVAIGNIAVGLISIGGFSFGLLSIGGLPLGIIAMGGISLGIIGAFGGIALSLGFAIGGVAFSYLIAVGGCAIAKVFAVGGVALADMTIGAEIKGIVGFYNQNGTGMYMYEYSKLNWQNIINVFRYSINSAKHGVPYLHDFVLQILTKLFI
ncbi:hypothetical protein IMX26_07705 [Clostridium sp. 'deep sea']|uniref:hypothetical protein n=1 Tax=Clostridium sp. 'deep sea' TaxID=2779445 RepID=UPI0018967998|nr:hypothetical protein [Clostridium sp. 'deep sea']QOR36681.1 hypothetical protein IMX26_07705 [Clostridium sp. 'deep sea']